MEKINSNCLWRKKDENGLEQSREGNSWNCPTAVPPEPVSHWMSPQGVLPVLGWIPALHPSPGVDPSSGSHPSSGYKLLNV